MSYRKPQQKFKPGPKRPGKKQSLHTMSIHTIVQKPHLIKQLQASRPGFNWSCALAHLHKLNTTNPQQKKFHTVADIISANARKSKILSKFLPPKDLTRYGIESHPGPNTPVSSTAGLSPSGENSVLFENDRFSVLNQAGRVFAKIKDIAQHPYHAIFTQNLQNNVDTPRPDPPKDLTTEGVEPNPGPKGRRKPVHMGGRNSNVPAIRGRGDYVSEIGSKLGSTAANFVVDKAVKGISKAGSWLWSKITGSGDYNVKHNSMIEDHRGKSYSQGPPMFREGSRSFVISHREYIGKVVGTMDFHTTSYQINPGNPIICPLFSQVAQCFEQYKIHGGVFQYNSTSTEYSSNVALGVVIMATSYNPNRPTFNSRAEMENEFFANVSKPSESFIHPLECAPNQTTIDEMFVRIPGTLVVDASLYDLGNFTVATEGVSPGDIGELWFSYEIEFFKPRFPNPYQLVVGTDHYTGTITDAQPENGFDFFQQTGGLKKSIGSSLNTTGTYATGPNQVFFPSIGRYMICMLMQPSDMTSPASGTQDYIYCQVTTQNSNASLVDIFYGGRNSGVNRLDQPCNSFPTPWTLGNLQSSYSYATQHVYTNIGTAATPDINNNCSLIAILDIKAGNTPVTLECINTNTTVNQFPIYASIIITSIPTNLSDTLPITSIQDQIISMQKSIDHLTQLNKNGYKPKPKLEIESDEEKEADDAFTPQLTPKTEEAYLQIAKQVLADDSAKRALVEKSKKIEQERELELSNISQLIRKFNVKN